MHYGSGTGGRRCRCAGQTLHVYSPDSSTFLREMTSRPSSWNYDVISEIRLRQAMCIYLINIKQSRQISSDPIWNDGALGFFEECHANKNSKKNDKMGSDMRSVPDPKNSFWIFQYFVLNIFCMQEQKTNIHRSLNQH